MGGSVARLTEAKTISRGAGVGCSSVFTIGVDGGVLEGWGGGGSGSTRKTLPWFKSCGGNRVNGWQAMLSSTTCGLVMSLA